MQQTAVAVAVTKDLTVVVLATILASRLSYFSSSVADVETTEVDSVVMTAVSGSFFCYSAAADSEAMAEAVAVVAATICAAN